jgi:hypothetical protein
MSQILAIRPAPFGTGNVKARFDAELDNGVRLYDLKLTESARGWRVYGPQHHGLAVITLPPLVADALADLARKAVADARTRHAA